MKWLLATKQLPFKRGDLFFLCEPGGDVSLEPEASEARLKIVRPILPENVDRLEIYDLRVGTASIDLLFERNSIGVTARVQEKRGTLEVITDAMV